MATAPDRAFRSDAAGIFRRTLPGTVAPDVHARALVGADRLRDGRGRRPGDGLARAWTAVGARLAGTLADDFAPVASSATWPWPESRVTYESALMPRALIVAGRLDGRPGADGDRASPSSTGS